MRKGRIITTGNFDWGPIYVTISFVKWTHLIEKSFLEKKSTLLHIRVKSLNVSSVLSDFIWDFGKLPFPSHLGKYI